MASEVSLWHLGGELEQELEGEDASLLPPSERLKRQNIPKSRLQQLLVRYRGPSLREYYPQLSFLQHPWIPSHLSSLVFTLLVFLIFILSIVSIFRWITREDKYQLPWRSYCTLEPEFPPAALALDSIPPVGLFIGVMSTARGFQKRQLIRSTWASHPKSRGGVDGKSEREGTSRTVVRFIVGAPSPSVEKKLGLENELYGDIVVLPIRENMNEGKTHAYFSWAYERALVPPPHLLQNTSPNINTTDTQAMFPRHDPWSRNFSDWVKPDYVVKADDDSFVMLAELEARLRVEHYKARVEAPTWDPLVYWGYMIKDYFMGGELYALSWPLVSFVATSDVVKTMTIGYEDQQVAKWIGTHPRASKVRWASERCWIYNHPKSGNVYAHGFLFPSEVQRVRKSIASNWTLERMPNMSLPTSWEIDSPDYSWSSVTGSSLRYMAPHLRNFTLGMEVEALVEGSALSQELSPRRHKGVESHANKNTLEVPGNQKPGLMTEWERMQAAYDLREDLQARYLGKNLGGTVVVHYVKKEEWFLETSLALLGDISNR
ncbi:Putative zinc metalloproteinase in scaA 5'region [Rhizoctonia solani]|uniref:Putative zinc metalloproteinase in scaA 5'region n=1 Tax=Rhizoctonia solani TaxID=456999 RepID=A0A0K6FYY6_9AGAM|nr:Putative zinc metalloproteinase in scaA 5'region [Rhizoctonia solani]